ncbi:endonuclease/exonuclease/phosphatase family metal-dependent hydrolase [Acholeplasma morum]|uniref:endonuclease/exonuclease/phosphatase family protein n=1 Tax=Paracholeplasma morum TaxID=264637 RepID=UPI00195BD487|nr:endonuclease/exonuclease/phosphatase family protein [Paracholeplasma morum]MBM7453747.1 endonuclease/exonuclease/phosphatase family metal-dependent hydrolase [Paracholeplasma morum]
MKILKKIVIVLFSLVVLVGILLGYLTIVEYRPKQQSTTSVKNNQTEVLKLNETYKSLTFNIGYASLGKDEDFVMDGGSKGRTDSKSVMQGYLEGIQNILLGSNSDFYLLQEVDQKSRRSYNENQVLSNAEALGDSYAYTFAYNFKAQFVPFPVSFTDYIGYVESGLQTFSKFKMDEAVRHQFPGEFSWPLRIANLKRAMVVHEYSIEGSDKKFILVNLHMSAYDGDGTLREQEMAYLKAFLNEQKTLGNYVMVGGDFNQTFPEAIGIYPPTQDIWVAYDMETDFLPEGYSFELDLTHPSCRLLNQPYDPLDSNTQYYIIDGFIVSDNISVTDVVNLNHGFLYSDHNPIEITFKLN